MKHNCRSLSGKDLDNLEVGTKPNESEVQNVEEHEVARPEDLGEELPTICDASTFEGMVSGPGSETSEIPSSLTVKEGQSADVDCESDEAGKDQASALQYRNVCGVIDRRIYKFATA